jgi:hypothetical protein
LSACLVLLTSFRLTDVAGSSPKLSELAGPKAQLAEAFEVKMFTNTRHRTVKSGKSAYRFITKT